MSVREPPVQNRICDIQDKDRAYKKHLDAVANAKSVIDTSSPDSRPPRPKYSARNPKITKNRVAAPPAQKATVETQGEEGVETTVKIGFEANPIVEEVRRRVREANRARPGEVEAQTLESSLKRSIRFEDDFLTDDSEEEGAGQEVVSTRPIATGPESFDEIPDLELPDF
jgi:hypothetical protein